MGGGGGGGSVAEAKILTGPGEVQEQKGSGRHVVCVKCMLDKEKGEEMFQPTFLGISKAHNSVWWSRLWYKMQQCRIEEKLARMCEGLYGGN